MQEVQSQYMQRAIQLAGKGLGSTAPNPLVGAVLVYNNKIIGEGYHQQYGQAHAEVNAIKNVNPAYKHLLEKATLYVTLEPCSHKGKTPPCADLIAAKKIPRVVIGSLDPNPKVSGRGIKKLEDAGIKVVMGVQKEDCAVLNKRFFTYLEKKRPYIILKWAQSADHFMALPGPRPIQLSNPLTNRLVHRWRSEEQGILIGSNTALIDDPLLTNRLWTGNSPTRIIVNKAANLPFDLNIFNDGGKTIIYNTQKINLPPVVDQVQVNNKPSFIEEVLADLHNRKFLSLIVEGGASILKSFLKTGLWDEARVITGSNYLKEGLPAPIVADSPASENYIVRDQIRYFKNNL